MPEAPYDLIPHNELTFDRNNPRIQTSDLSQILSEADMAVFLYQSQAVRELVTSMAPEGYFPQEPMTVTREHDSNIVLDGNRRLAAIRVLTDPEIASRVQAPPFTPSPQALETLERIPVFVTDRMSNWRHPLKAHTHGPIRWMLHTRAKHIHHLHDEQHLSHQQLADQTGYSRQHVAQLYQDAEVARQAEQTLSCDPAARTVTIMTFSLLHQALSMENILSFIGLPHQPSLRSNPVPGDHLAQLKDLVVWLYGNDAEDQPSIIQESERDLQKLNEILADLPSLQELRKTRNLFRTYEKLNTPPPSLHEALNTAQQALQEAERALQQSTDTPSPQLLGRAREIAAMADNISDRRRYTTNPQKESSKPTAN